MLCIVMIVILLFSFVFENVSVLGDTTTFDRCALAKTLYFSHSFSYDQTAMWVCIAKYQSNFNSAALNYNSNGVGYHGLYQISDRYWCAASPSALNACSLSCASLRDKDLSDDFACIRQIFAEHERISGSGYSAWTAYESHCSRDYQSVVADCFPSIAPNIEVHVQRTVQPSSSSSSVHSVQRKVYHRCELARELRFVHNIADANRLATWVCIAHHESHFNTSAVGRKNSDGSADHGIFQISDIYWCSSSSPTNGWALCRLNCDKLEDSNIADDVECMLKIFDEHEKISGDGFNAWAVYQPHCQRYQVDEYVEGCFDDDGDNEVNSVLPARRPAVTSPPVRRPSVKIEAAKIYERCELARELRYVHDIESMDHLGTWVCIAKHESNYRTNAVGRLNADGSADHGLFQISDLYWCTASDEGSGVKKACGIQCDQLEDSDITDDVQCMLQIHEEHQRLSGNGFTAWAVYGPYCKTAGNFVLDCFDEGNHLSSRRPAITAPPPIATKTVDTTGKVYSRCELARELRSRHQIPSEQISTWVCIAENESHFNTSAIGRRNSDGSLDHGIFQISDIYWCRSSTGGAGWACGRNCDEFHDSDIADDVECMLKIYQEHEAISGDGFNAWAVYGPKCRGRAAADQYVVGCFADDEASIGVTDEYTNSVYYSRYQQQVTSPLRPTTLAPSPTAPITADDVPIGKVYTPCELALELRDRHGIPQDQIATWVCIAKYESRFNTSAVGRLSGGGSEDHGLFQISDIYWCSPPGKGWVCGLSCAQLEDSDITDDVQCMRKIYDEHQRLSGDGFNAWTVYGSRCKGAKAESYVDGCFGEQPHEVTTTRKVQSVIKTTTTKPIKRITTITSSIATTKISTTKQPTATSKTTAKRIETSKPFVLNHSNSIAKVTKKSLTTTMNPSKLATTKATTSAKATATTKKISISTRPSKSTQKISQPSTTEAIKTTKKSVETKLIAESTTKIEDVKTTTDSPFAIYLNGYKTKQPSTIYKFTTKSYSRERSTTKPTGQENVRISSAQLTVAEIPFVSTNRQLGTSDTKLVSAPGRNVVKSLPPISQAKATTTIRNSREKTMPTIQPLITALPGLNTHGVPLRYFKNRTEIPHAGKFTFSAPVKTTTTTQLRLN